MSTVALKIMSYNVLMNLEKTGRPATALDDMISTIRAEDPDILGTQENIYPIHEAFEKGLPEYSFYKGAIIYDSDGRGNYVYWKTDKFNVVEKGSLYMSDTPDVKSKFEGSKENRCFTYLIFESKETGSRFLYVNIHTDYRADESIRVKQMRCVTAFLKAHANLPAIVGGDLNATPNATSLMTFKAENPTIALTSEAANSKGDVGGTLDGGEFMRRDAYVFDHIFVHTDRIAINYYSVVNNLFKGKYPSDHLPVVAHLDLHPVQ